MTDKQQKKYELGKLLKLAEKYKVDIKAFRDKVKEVKDGLDKS